MPYLFSNDTFHDRPSDYSEITLKRALEYQENMEADFGGTEVLNPLKAVYQIPITGEGWKRQIIFLTDGGVTNQTEVRFFTLNCEVLTLVSNKY